MGKKRVLPLGLAIHWWVEIAVSAHRVIRQFFRVSFSVFAISFYASVIKQVAHSGQLVAQFNVCEVS